ncbi:MAG TPA: hypothetical protein PK950_03275 [Candidatus Paceibacterota bacterium]|nr:hypothetical protein [Candidatus Paceibacterota bacterium]
MENHENNHEHNETQSHANPPVSRKNKKTLKIIAIIALVVIAAGAVWYATKPKYASNLVGGEYAVAGITNAFGANLKMVSLTAEPALIAESMDRQYKPFVTEKLLADWKADPTKAIGRLTSSPYPDKIEIASVSKVSKKSYVVTGNVIEVATGTKGAVTTVSVYPITLTYKNIKGVWLIDELVKGEPTAVTEE